MHVSGRGSATKLLGQCCRKVIELNFLEPVADIAGPTYKQTPSMCVAKQLSKNNGYTCIFLCAMATRHSQNCSATNVDGGCMCKPFTSNVCDMLQKDQFDDYSATLSQQFCCKVCPLATYATFWFDNPSLQSEKGLLRCLCE